MNKSNQRGSENLKQAEFESSEAFKLRL